MDPLEPAGESFPGGTSSQALLELQRQLQNAFPECDANSRPFTAHSSLGQCSGEKQPEQVVEEVVHEMDAFLEGYATQDREGQEAGGPSEMKGLHWLIDRVFVLERKGYKDPFHVVGEIML